MCYTLLTELTADANNILQIDTAGMTKHRLWAISTIMINKFKTVLHQIIKRFYR